MNRRLLLAILLVAICIVLRVAPHPWNLTPAGSIALFSGACFERKRWAFGVPLLSMFISDIAVGGLHVLTPVVYATFALIVVAGMLLRSRRRSPLAVAGGAFSSATIFYVVTNFAMWTISTIFPKTFAGLVSCYIAGIPYYGTMLAGDLIYSALLFGTFVWAERSVTAEA